MVQNVFLQNDGKHNAPIFGYMQTAKELVIDQDLS